jgi:hypothetical protein
MSCTHVLSVFEPMPKSLLMTVSIFKYGYVRTCTWCGRAPWTQQRASRTGTASGMAATMTAGERLRPSIEIDEGFAYYTRYWLP